MIPWYVFAFGTAILNTFFQIVRKKALNRIHAMNFESLRCLFVAFLCLFLIPLINLSFNKNVLLLIYVVSWIITIGILYAAKAFRHGDVSLISPLANLRPAFVAIMAFIFLGELLTIEQISGIILILISAYFLESNHHISNFLEPIKNLLKSKYSLFYVLTTFLFGVASIIDKYILTYKISNIYTYFFFVWIFLAINFNIVHLFRFGLKDTIKGLKRAKHLPFLVALISLGANLAMYKAISIAYVSLVMPVMMSSTLFIVLFGGRFFHEKYLLFRVGATLIMIIGAYLVIT